MGWKQRLVEIHEQEIARRQHLPTTCALAPSSSLFRTELRARRWTFQSEEIERNEQLIRMLQNLNAQLRAKIQEEGDEDEALLLKRRFRWLHGPTRCQAQVAKLDPMVFTPHPPALHR